MPTFAGHGNVLHPELFNYPKGRALEKLLGKNNYLKKRERIKERIADLSPIW